MTIENASGNPKSRMSGKQIPALIRLSKIIIYIFSSISAKRSYTRKMFSKMIVQKKSNAM